MITLTCVHFIDAVEKVIGSAGNAVAAHTQAAVGALIPGVVGPAGVETKEDLCLNSQRTAEVKGNRKCVGRTLLIPHLPFQTILCKSKEEPRPAQKNRLPVCTKQQLSYPQPPRAHVHTDASTFGHNYKSTAKRGCFSLDLRVMGKKKSNHEWGHLKDKEAREGTFDKPILISSGKHVGRGRMNEAIVRAGGSRRVGGGGRLGRPVY